jgi:integrase
MVQYIPPHKLNITKHSPGHLDCPACAGALAVLPVSLSPDLLFVEAFNLWLSWRSIERPEGSTHVTDASYLAPRTVKDYRACASALAKFFGRLKLGEIHAGHLRTYQSGRAFCDRAVGDWRKPCQANRIRKEVTLLIRILRDARLWGAEESDRFQPLRPVESNVNRSMSPDEQRRFLAYAASRTEWQFVHWYAVVALQTCASTNELRGLRLGDVLLHQGLLQIRSENAKNKYRIRTIPLETAEVVWALERLIERANTLGAAAPHHCLFPIQEAKGCYNPNYPMSDSGLKKRWAAVRSASGLDWLRPYDLRHTAITRMAEAGAPIQVIMSFAGHMTMRMQQHYTTISLMAKRQWARSAWEEPVARTAPRRPAQERSGVELESHAIPRIGPAKVEGNQVRHPKDVPFFNRA